MSEMLIGRNGRRAARLVLRTCRQMRRDTRVSGVVIRQKAARVFITWHGLPGPNVRPWPIAKCRASSDLLRISYTHSFDAFHKITEINRNTITQQQIVFQYFAYWLAHSSNYTLDSHSIFQYEWHKPLPSARSKWISSINLKIIVTYLSDQ